MSSKKRFYLYLLIVQVFLIILTLLTMNGLVTFVRAQTDTSLDYYNSPTTIALAISAAICMAVSGIAAAWVIRTVGTAAISALSEREGAFGKLVVIVALGEAIAIYGLIVALLLVFKIPSPPV